MAKRITGKTKNSTGGCTHYQIDNKIVVTRAEGVKMQKRGELPEYNIITVNGKEYLRDNPDNNKKDNINNQKDI